MSHHGGIAMNKQKMRFWMAVWLVFVLPGALLAGCASQAGVGALQVEEVAATPDYAAVTAELAPLIQAAVEEAGVTGLSVALVDDQEMVWSEGFGYADKENGIEATPETVYMVASVSKLFTAAAIMQLADQGKIDIDQPVQTYVPEFSINSRFSEAGPITPRTLMNHHSGLPSDITNGMVAYGDDQDALTRSEFHNLVDGIKQTYVTNPPNIEYVQDHILAPLGMENTDFTYSNQAMIAHAAAPAFPAAQVEDVITMMAQAGGPDGAGFIRQVDERFAWMNRFNVMAANGGLIGPATEAMRFAQMHLNGGELDGVRILSAEAVVLMQEMQNSTTGDPLGYGVAWRVHDEAEHPYVEHDGGGEGLWAKMRLYPEEGLAIVLMSNASGWNRDRVADAAANVVFSMMSQ
jgi:CubicO group peptidase (beta-lactamase class C family)